MITVLLCIVIFTPVKETTFMIKAQNDIRHQINRWIDSDSNDDNTQLAIPKKQEFAINNIQMNMTKKDVEAQLGQHKRMTSSVYGTNWYTYYSNDYNQFLMVSYINNHVNALYTNQNLISSKSQIKYDTPKDVVRERYGPPIQVIKKGKVGFDVKSNEYDVFHKDHI
ncbi:CAP-associated domain-containing protein, partial [Staphylococcus sp.]|uniref:CAP-associated domain-containing protein n=1 Tax=Staphylococcus sp. TaxID=29387 RepID=UPI0029118776